MVWNALRAGMKAPGLLRKATGFADEAWNAAKQADALKNIGRPVSESAADAARFTSQKAQFMDDFLADYASRNPAFMPDNMVDKYAYLAGKGLSNTGNVAGNVVMNPVAQMGLFTAPMFLSAPPQTPDEEYVMYLNQQRGY